MAENSERWNYRDFARLMRERVATGVYPKGTYLPSERVLADEFGINRRTLRRGLDLLEQEGLLSPDSTRGVLVRSPRGNVTNAIGVCFDDSINRSDRVASLTMERSLILQGIQRRLNEEDDAPRPTLLTPWTSTTQPTRTFDLHSLHQMGVAGLALWPTLPPQPDQAVRLRAIRNELPLVLLDRRVVGFECDFVGFDDYQAGRLLGEHLLSIGHRRFAFVGWPVPETVYERLRGLEDALHEAGANLPLEWTFLTRDDGVIAGGIPALLTEAGRGRAIVCANDLIAIGLILWLQDQGFRVPADFSVVGVGNSIDGMVDACGLTTVALPHENVGWEAADRLLARLRDPRANGDSLYERRLPVRLVVRRSCGIGSMPSPAIS